MKQNLPFAGMSPGSLVARQTLSAARPWRPFLAAALGLLTLGAQAQHRALVRPAFAEVAIPQPLPAVPTPAQPSKSQAAHKSLAAISSTAAGGIWSAPATWVGGVVPTATDDVTIVGGATVTLDVAAACASLTVASAGSLLNSATTAYVLQVGGNVTNNGTLDLSASSTIGSDLRFTGAGNATFSGTGTTDLQTVSLAKSVRADVVEMNLPSFTVKGSATITDGFLSTRITTNTVDDMTGTFKISGTNTASNRVFSNAASYFIPATGGFWLNNPNFTVAAQTGSPTVNGLLRVSAGTYNVGSSIGNSINFSTGSVYTQEGGTLTTVGRFTSFTSATSAAAMTFTMSAGTLNVSTVGNTSGTPSFGVNGTTTISGGNINLVQRSTATTPLDYYVAGTYTFTGGTVNVGTAATATNFDFRVRGNMPNLTIDNTTNPKSALLAGQTNPFGTVLINPTTTLNLNGTILLQLGPTISVNGTLTGTATGSRLYFQGSTAQTIGGTGTVTSPLVQLTFQNSGSGVTVGLPIIVRNVAMFRGNVIGANNLTVQSTTTALAVISFGIASPTSSAGSFDVAPTFDLSTSGLYLIYNPELAARTTGVEVPSSRILYYADFNNPQGITVAGGDLTVVGPSTASSSISLLAGIVTTSAGNRLISGVATTVMPAGSATAYVKGPLGATVNSATAVSRLFAVGDAAGFRPVVVTGITTSADQTFTATVINGATGGTGVSPVTNLNPTRYVRLENTANLPATARVQLSYGADDVLGNAATAVVAQAPTAAGAYASIGGAAATTPTTGLVSTLDLVPGNDYFVLANTEGGTLTGPTAAVCAGTNSGTLTLANNVGTIVKYQADSGSGFVDVPGTNTGATYAFTNLTATTTFRAVILTADNRTVFSTPVTVTVNPAPTATLTTTTPTTFCAGGSVVLTAPAGTGNTYQFFNGPTSLGAASATNTFTATASGSYTVVVTNAATCQATSAVTTVTVNPATTATFSYSGTTYCASGTNPTPTVTGTVGGTFSSASGLSINATTGAINLSASTLGTYTVTYSVGGACPSSATATVTVTSAPLAGFSYASPAYCVGGTNPTPAFATGASGGSFSASGTGLVINATTGAINLATSTAGTYTVTNTIAASGGCAAATATTSVTINAAPTATLTTTTPTTFCAGGSVVLTAPAGTGNTYQFFNGPTSLGAASATNTFTATASGSYTVVVTNAATCQATSAVTTVTVNPATTATFSYPGATYCVSGTANPTATVTGTAGGTFTSSGTGLSINATTGAITLASSTPGTYTVTYSVGGTCPSTATASVTITAAPVATFSYANATYCVSGTNPTAVVPTTSTAGTFTSTTGLTLNATTGAITLSSSTPGTYTVTNTVAAAGGCAATTATASVTISAAPVAAFSYGTGTPTFCVSGTTAPAVTLGTGATAGTFTSTTGLTINATTGAITLSSSTPGTYTVTNTVAAAGGCAATTATTSVTITAAPLATFSYATAAGCVGSASAVTPTLGTGATAGTFSSTTGLTINATTGAITLSTSTAGTYTVTNTVAAAGGCAAATATTTFTVNPRPATPTISVAYNGSTTTLTSSATTGNQWYLGSGPVTGATGQTLVLTGLPSQLGSYTVTTTNANGCVSLPSNPLVVTSSVKALTGTSLSVYPNPTPDGRFTVELSGYRQSAELTVLNALGQVVYTTNVPASNGTTSQAVDLTQLAMGVYILRVKTEGGLDTRRVVKQ
ncbi:T9SS type A sorting domain-containing protein [Hymenobacter sp. M29]|uniref:T9SS type A sorting domain-containing protein n=1 Tax=Hymenobacter mellowenesis TaxID=3063995 RepID=A0ABT9A979_9BACT|nr:T9SS type A sorting domain-containing protein [Hymenobacter sp. M29]MDO7846399.1 T9SS type A sorting domain-containing protein [Hymenobacter sp. M29]